MEVQADEVKDLRTLVIQYQKENEFLSRKVAELEAKLRAMDPTCGHGGCDDFSDQGKGCGVV